MSCRTPILIALVFTLQAAPGRADWTEARCDVYPAGDDHTEVMIPCRFSQRQGYVTITRSDGMTHELAPESGTPGNFRDQDGRAVYRQSRLGDQGLIFRFPDESVFVYWNTAALQPADEENPTWPFTTSDYDATMLLLCRAAIDAAAGRCPAGVLRMEDKQASVVIMSPAGEQFTINFMRDYINAANRQVDAVMAGDTWILTVDGHEVYEVPLAVIEGG